jgi:hypothetical protein
MNATVSKKGSSPLSYFLGKGQNESAGKLCKTILKIQESILSFLGMMLLLFLHGNPRLVAILGSCLAKRK